MARRKKISFAEDFIDMVTMLPWWAGITLAIISYIFFHYFAAQPLTISRTVTNPGQLVSHSLFRAIATVTQYFVPLLSLVGAGLSFWKRRKRAILFERATSNPAADNLDNMSWQEFEILVGGSFRQQGYRVMETGGYGADGGVDLVLTKDNEKFLVQCKQWKAYKVSVEVVRELYGVMAAKGAAGGMVVTSGRFTDPAIEFAQGRNIKLINGIELHAMIHKTKTVNQDISILSNASINTSNSEINDTTYSNSPACPICSMEMIQRKASRGQNAGGLFWACSGYPSCRGTRQIA